MILRKIEALRLQPKYIRVRYAFTLSFLITFCIGVVWSYALFVKLNPAQEETVVVEDVPSSLSRFLGNLRDSLYGTTLLFKPTTEYVREEEKKPQTPTLDLDALFASSTVNAPQLEKQTGTSTNNTQLHAATSSTKTTEETQ
jgi:hypothetical protein